MSELLPEQQNEALHCQNGSSASFGSGQGKSVTARLLGQAAPADLTCMHYATRMCDHISSRLPSRPRHSDVQAYVLSHCTGT